ncbi:MAG TPA: aldose 1-epimerase [Terriglobales bacterium]|nr:aldose 1-epimerase [Terriglobales bacterium]
MTSPAARARNYGCRFTEFIYLGYAALALENDKLRISLLPGKGSDVIQFLYKPQDVDFMYVSQPGLQPAGAVKAPTANGNAFLDYYPGGWQEILPNFGDPCEYKNAALGLHDEISLLPWKYTILQDELDCISVLLEVQCVRTPFRLRKTLTLRPGGTLEIAEELQNDSAEKMDCTWGHHPAFGAPFLDDSCHILAPSCRVKTQEEYVSPNSRLEKGQDREWPIVLGRNGEKIDLSRIPAKSVHSHDMAYLYGFDRGWYGLFSDRLQVGFGISWDANVFKYLWFWQVYGGWAGYPWYGKGYNIGLEPVSSYPGSLANAVAAGTQLVFAPGETKKTQLRVSVFTKPEQFASESSSALLS